MLRELCLQSLSYMLPLTQTDSSLLWSELCSQQQAVQLCVVTDLMSRVSALKIRLYSCPFLIPVLLFSQNVTGTVQSTYQAEILPL